MNQWVALRIYHVENWIRLMERNIYSCMSLFTKPSIVKNFQNEQIIVIEDLFLYF